jgi:hypothetical protein
MKKRLTDQQEFEVMKLVLDKFLWIGAIIMIIGLWSIFNTQILEGISYIAIGAVVLIILLILIVKEYEIVA